MGDADLGIARKPWVRGGHAPVLVGATAGVSPVVIPAVVHRGSNRPGLGWRGEHGQQ